MQTTDQLNAALSGRYAIERLIGEGGMATVYLARDVKHNRKVALKVLKPDLGAIVGVDRFLAEIEVTANLQHPNLLPLFDSGATDGLLFYVMPYVQGESLRARLDREKQLPIDEVVRMSSAIASALDYAHRHNVIHRDLKPENILLHDGQPLVADFGIALAVSNAGGNRITQTGLSLGTPQYMSPEQATGDRTIDARTDLYSLGAVTYEMLTGEPPHIGNTSQAIIARVLTERPRSIRSSRPNVPDHIEAAVMQALEKLPADRFASAKEFSEALSGARGVVHAPARATSAQGGGTVEFVPARTKRSRAVSVVPWLLLLVATVFAVLLLMKSAPPPPVLARFGIELPDSVQLYPGSGGSKVTLSRDGSMMLVVGRKVAESWGLYLRRLNDPVAERVRGTDSAVHASFSRDGQWIAFSTSGAQLKKVSVGGGKPTVLADSAGNPHWGDGDLIVFNRGSGVSVTTAAVGEARQIAGPDSTRRIVSVSHAELLPGDEYAVVTIRKGANMLDSSYIALVKLENGELTELNIAGTNPRYAVSGHLVFARAGGEVYAVPFSLRKRAITGPAELLLQDVSQWPGGPTNFAISENGTLVYHTGGLTAGNVRSLKIVNKQGVEERLKGAPAFYTDPRISPDGRRVAFDFRDNGSVQQIRGDVYVEEIATGARSRISSSGASVRAEWTRDGANLVYIDQPPVGSGQDSSMIIIRPWDKADGAVVHARGTANGGLALNTVSVGPPGGWAAFRIGDNTATTDVWIAPMDSLNARRPFIATTFREKGPAVSPNGRLLAYASDETGTDEVYVVTLPVAGTRLPVSIGGGTEPAWSRDGTQLYYRGPVRMMVAGIAERPALVRTRIDSLFIDNYFRERWHRQYDVFADGRFMMIGNEGAAPTVRSNLFAIVNWQQMLGGQQAGVAR